MQEELDFMGASLEASSGRDYTTLRLRILKQYLDKGLDLFLEALTQPTFPASEVRREIEKTLAAVRAAEEQPGEVAKKAFRRALFLSSPYGHPIEGTLSSLPTLTRQALVRFYREYYHPNNAILAVVGDITTAEVEAKLLPKLAAWPSASLPEIAFSSSVAQGPKTILIDRPVTQANVVLGHIGISRNNPDYYALQVMNYLLGGGGFASRLMEEIRNKRGLAYAVASLFETGKYPEAFQIVLQTKNASAREAIALARQQMERMRTEMVSAHELEGAKKYLVGSFPLRLGTQAKLANFLIQVEYYGLGLDYAETYPMLIDSVTREDVLRVARTYLHPERAILVVVADLQEAGME
jgi:zinc protease